MSTQLIPSGRRQAADQMSSYAGLQSPGAVAAKAGMSTATSASTLSTDKMIQGCVGYTYKNTKGSWHVPLNYLIRAVVWFAIRFLPSLSTMLLTSSAVHMTGLATSLLAKCPLQQAKYVLVKMIDGRTYMVRTERYSMSPPVEGCGGRFEQASVDNVRVGAYRRAHQTRPRHQKLLVFKLFLRQYVYCSVHDTFEALPSMPNQLPARIRKALNSLQAINLGADWARFNVEQSVARRNMLQLYGNKKWLFDRSQVYTAASRHALPSIFVIQFWELVYLIYRRYWFYAIVMHNFTFMGLVGLLHTLHKQHDMLVSLINRKRVVPIVQAGWIRAAVSYQLVPGDVVVVQRGKATCDMVLLRGSCLVEESMLSGEVAQMRKSQYVPDHGRDYHPDNYHACTVYAGTIVKQVWNADDAEDEVLAMVVRTGLNTTMGAMVRQLIAPVDVKKEKDPFEPDVLRLYKFALVLQLLVLIPYCLRARYYHESARQVILKVLDTLVHSAPPPVPAIMLLCGFAVIARLRKHGMTLLYPEVLKLGANCDVVCFDKTGTLTGTTAVDCQRLYSELRSELDGIVPVEDGQFQVLQRKAENWSNRLKQALAWMLACSRCLPCNKVVDLVELQSELHGIVPVADGQFQVLQQTAVNWSNRLKQALASCHGLTVVNRTTVVGDEVERSLFKAVEARYRDRSNLVLPRRPDKRSSASMVNLSILRVLDFNSQTLKSGVVITSDDAPDGSALIFIKGAPNVIKDTVMASSVPSNFEQVTDELSSKAFRLMALAVGVLPKVAKLDLQQMSQQQLERRTEKLEMLGLIVLTNHIKPDSRDTVTELQDKGGIRTMIITGDYHHTAIATARDVGMITPKARIIVIDTAITPHQNASPIATPAQSARTSLDDNRPQRSLADMAKSHGCSVSPSLDEPRPGQGHSVSFIQHASIPKGQVESLQRGIHGQSMSHVQPLSAPAYSLLPGQTQGRQLEGLPSSEGVGQQHMFYEAPQPSGHSAPALQQSQNLRITSQHGQQSTAGSAQQQPTSQPSRHSFDSLQHLHPPVASGASRSAMQQGRLSQLSQTPLEKLFEATQQKLQSSSDQTMESAQVSDQQQQQQQSVGQEQQPSEQQLQSHGQLQQLHGQQLQQLHGQQLQQQQSSVQQSVDAHQKPPAQELQLPLHQQQPPHYHALLAQQPQQRSRLSLDGRSQHRPPQKPLQISSVAENLQPLGLSAIGATSNATTPDAAVPSASSLSQPAVASLTPSRRQLAAVHGQNIQHRSSGKGSPEASSSRMEIKSACPLTPSQSARQLLTPLVIHPSTQPSLPPSPAPGVDGLRFVLGLGTKTMSPNQALTALAEGQVQCAITGAAFQHLLESSDLDALEIVMRSVVVFARMQPHQKGRAVELLTIKGVHQMHNGSSRHVQGLGHVVIFVGDGINDLVALSAADIGYAVGATDAMVAAAISTSRSSVAGVCRFIKEGKGGHSLILSLFRYMVVYLLAIAISENVAFAIDGSQFSTIQHYGLDFQAISLAFLATVLPPVEEMTRHRPPVYVGIRRTYILVTVMTMLWAATNIGTFAFLLKSSWLRGSNSTAVNNPVNTFAWLTANIELLGPVISLGVDTRLFVKPIYKTGFYIPVALAYLILSVLSIMAGPVHRANIFHLALFPQQFRFQMEGLAAAAVVLFWVVVATTRRIINRLEGSQVSPV